VGLLQREIEKAGISTVSISNVPEITERVCVPRAVFVQYPFGRLLGLVGERSGQRRICDDMIETLVSAQSPNQYVHLPYEWPEPPEDTRWRPDEPPPLGKYAREKNINLPDTLLKAMQDAETKG
jgi:D-proline reductase (dithiol) PrdB